MVWIIRVDSASKTTRAGCRPTGAIIRGRTTSRIGECRPRRKALLPALAVLLPIACFQYAAVPVTSPPEAGHHVRMELTAEGISRIAETLGSDVALSGRRVEGDLVNADAARFLV